MIAGARPYGLVAPNSSCMLIEAGVPGIGINQEQLVYDIPDIYRNTVVLREWPASGTADASVGVESILK